MIPPWMRLTYLVGCGLTLLFVQQTSWQLREGARAQGLDVDGEGMAWIFGLVLALAVFGWPFLWAVTAGAELAKYLERRGPPPTGA